MRIFFVEPIEPTLRLYGPKGVKIPKFAYKIFSKKFKSEFWKGRQAQIKKQFLGWSPTFGCRTRIWHYFEDLVQYDRVFEKTKSQKWVL